MRITSSQIGPVSKNIHFPAEFKDFIQLLAHLEATLGTIFVEVVEDKSRKVKNALLNQTRESGVGVSYETGFTRTLPPVMKRWVM